MIEGTPRTFVQGLAGFAITTMSQSFTLESEFEW